MNLPKALARAREAKGLSQVELAKRLRVSKGTVGGWENGSHGIRTKRLRDIAKILGVELDELVA